MSKSLAVIHLPASESFDPMEKTRQLLALQRSKPLAQRQPVFEDYLELCIKVNSPMDSGCHDDRPERTERF